MRFLAVADLYGRPERWRAVTRAVADRHPDGLLVAGDVAPRRVLERVLNALNALKLPVFMVRGNSEGRRLDAKTAAFSNLTLLTAKPLQLGKVYISGLGGALPLPFANRICWRERAHLASLVPIPRPSILVVHPPPYGLLDEVLGGLHTGSRALIQWIERHRPDLVVCGHIHARSGVANHGTTTVVNCAVGPNGGGALIEVVQGQHRVVSLPPLGA